MPVRHFYAIEKQQVLPDVSHEAVTSGWEVLSAEQRQVFSAHLSGFCTNMYMQTYEVLCTAEKKKRRHEKANEKKAASAATGASKEKRA